jgi:uncharacterized protein YegL
MSSPIFEPFGEDMFLNTERRCPVILCLDTSSSMTPHIGIVNQGLRALKADLQTDILASQRVEIAIVTFGPVQLVQDFVTVDHWVPPTLHPQGNTPLGEALIQSIQQITIRKRAYREAGVPYYRPWLWLVTDGAPTDNWQKGLSVAQAEIQRGGLELFTIGTDGADFSILRTISSPRQPVRLREAKYREMFVWLSQSLKPVSKSDPGSKLQLPDPREWGEITS